MQDSLSGLLVIDKPSGPTSHDIVAAARRILREKRIGHTGTLDPLATGVLPLVIGRATRLASLLSSTDKQYIAGIRLGTATATYDAAERLESGGGPPIAPDLAPEVIQDALQAFRGQFEQVPPPFSAKKVGGVRAYRLARTEQPLELKPVTVTVRELTWIALEDGLLTLSVTATAGFYVRSLAHDLGQRLGCGAHLESLRRMRAGGFGLEHAVTLAELQDRPELAIERLVPMAELGTHLPGVRVTQAGRVRVSHGNTISVRDILAGGSVPEASAGERVRILAEDGSLIAVAIFGSDGTLRPSVVLV